MRTVEEREELVHENKFNVRNHECETEAHFRQDESHANTYFPRTEAFFNSGIFKL